ncbi:MAG: DUF692 family protein [Proteobacteria bacterium]|nr:DUF692 family protein [Pseudomonadota bacterium]
MQRPRVGLGFRPEFATELVARPDHVDFVEVVAETCFTQRATRREACALAAIWPVIPHGVKLSLGSADGVELDRARRLGALARELRAPMISEHVSFTRAGEIDVGHLTQLPRTREAIAIVARNVARVRRVLPDVPLLLENVAWSFRWPDDEMDEATFYQEIVAATGCDLLLDVGNLYANPVPPAVMALVGAVVARDPDVPVLIERDANMDFAAVAGELAAIRALPRGAARPAARARSAVTPAAPTTDALARVQRELAGQLVRGEPATPIADRIGRVAMDRARGILQRKRIDDALPLVANLAQHDDERLRAVATAALAPTFRQARGAGPADAWRIATAARAVPELAAAAAIDQLLLRARFAGPDHDGVLRPRRAPFYGRARLDDGRRLRATKGIGARAEVKLLEKR